MDLSMAAHCPRKLYYSTRDDQRRMPHELVRLRELAFRYPYVLSGGKLPSDLLDVTPTQVRATLGCAKERLEDWDGIADPPQRHVVLEGREARGIADKVLANPVAPVLITDGRPPAAGAWRPDVVRAVAAAKALSWAQEVPVDRAYVEYPATGAIRRVRLSTRQKAFYREAVAVADTLDGPPPRVDDAEKCESCKYRARSGPRTRSLRSLL